MQGPGRRQAHLSPGNFWPDHSDAGVAFSSDQGDAPADLRDSLGIVVNIEASFPAPVIICVPLGSLA
jgi:hypothetical protein